MDSQRNPMMVRAAGVAISCILFAACATIYAPTQHEYDVSQITAVGKSNGGIIKIFADKRINDVAAWLGDNNLLYITIPDTSIDARRLSQLVKSSMVAKVEFFRYKEAVQVTLQLREKMDHVEVVHYPGNYDVYVVLYQAKSNS